MADDSDVEIGVDGSEAQKGVDKIVASLNKIGTAAAQVANSAGQSFSKIYERLNAIGDSSALNKFTGMISKMEGAADQARAAIDKATESMKGYTSTTASQVDAVAASLNKLSAFKGPSAASVANTEKLFLALSGVKLSSTLRYAEALSALSGYRGPSGSSVENTILLLEALGTTKISSSLKNLSSLDALAGYRGPSKASITNTENLLNVLANAKFSNAKELSMVLKSVGEAAAGLAPLAARARAATTSLNGIGGGARAGAGGIAGLAHSFQGLNALMFRSEQFFTTFGQLSGLSAVTNQIQKWDAANSSLMAVTHNQAEAAQELGFVADTSQRLGVSLEATVPSWARFRAAAMNTNIGVDDLKTTFAGITQATRVFGLSQEQTTRVFADFDRMMAQGTVTQRQLHQLEIQMPTTYLAMARAMGKTTAELTAMVRAGKLTGPALEQAITGTAKQLEIMSAGGLYNSQQSISASFANLSTAFMLLSRNLGTAGINDAVRTLTQDLIQAIQPGHALYNLFISLAQGLDFVAHNLGPVITLVGIGLVGKMTQGATATGLATAANNAYAASLAKIAVEKGIVTAEELGANVGNLSNAGSGVTGAAKGISAVESVGLDAEKAAATVNGLTMMERASLTLSKGFGVASAAAGGLMEALGFTNIFLVFAAGVVAAYMALEYFSTQARAARDAQKSYQNSLDLSQSSLVAMASNLQEVANKYRNVADAATQAMLADTHYADVKAHLGAQESYDKLIQQVGPQEVRSARGTVGHIPGTASNPELDGLLANITKADTEFKQGNLGDSVTLLNSTITRLSSLKNIPSMSEAYGKNIDSQSQAAAALKNFVVTAGANTFDQASIVTHDDPAKMAAYMQSHGNIKIENASDFGAALAPTKVDNTAATKPDNTPLSGPISKLIQDIPEIRAASEIASAANGLLNKGGAFSQKGYLSPGDVNPPTSELTKTIKAQEDLNQAFTLGAKVWSDYRASIHGETARKLVPTSLNEAYQAGNSTARGIVGQIQGNMQNVNDAALYKEISGAQSAADLTKGAAEMTFQLNGVGKSMVEVLKQTSQVGEAITRGWLPASQSVNAEYRVLANNFSELASIDPFRAAVNSAADAMNRMNALILEVRRLRSEALAAGDAMKFASDNQIIASTLQSRFSGSAFGTLGKYNAEEQENAANIGTIQGTFSQVEKDYRHPDLMTVYPTSSGSPSEMSGTSAAMTGQSSGFTAPPVAPVVNVAPATSPEVSVAPSAAPIVNVSPMSTQIAEAGKPYIPGVSGTLDRSEGYGNIPLPSSISVDAPSSIPVLAPSSIPVSAPRSISVDAPSAIPVLSPRSIPVDAPSSIPVEAPTSVAMTSPPPLTSRRAEPSLTPMESFAAGMMQNPVPVSAPSNIPVSTSMASPLPVAAPSSIPVAMTTPAPIQVSAPSTIGVSAPDAIPVLAPSSIPVSAPRSIPVTGIPSAIPVNAPTSIPLSPPDAKVDEVTVTAKERPTIFQQTLNPVEMTALQENNLRHGQARYQINEQSPQGAIQAPVLAAATSAGSEISQAYDNQYGGHDSYANYLSSVSSSTASQKFGGGYGTDASVAKSQTDLYNQAQLTTLAIKDQQQAAQSVISSDPIGDTLAKVNTLQDALKQLKDASATALPGSSEAADSARAIGLVNTALDQTKAKLAEAELASTKFGATLNSTVDSVSDALASLASGTQVNWNTIFRSIEQSTVKSLVVEPLANQTKSFLANSIPGLAPSKDYGANVAKSFGLSDVQLKQQELLAQSGKSSVGSLNTSAANTQFQAAVTQFQAAVAEFAGKGLAGGLASSAGGELGGIGKQIFTPEKVGTSDLMSGVPLFAPGSPTLTNPMDAMSDLKMPDLSDINPVLPAAGDLTSAVGGDAGGLLSGIVSKIGGAGSAAGGAASAEFQAAVTQFQAAVAQMSGASALGGGGGLGGIGSLFGGGGGGLSIPGLSTDFSSIGSSLVNPMSSMTDLALPDLMDILPVLHSGGIIGSSNSAGYRSVPMSVFANAQRFHSGGVIGAGEQPIIGRKGEEVLSANNPRHINNARSSSFNGPPSRASTPSGSRGGDTNHFNSTTNISIEGGTNMDQTQLGDLLTKAAKRNADATQTTMSQIVAQRSRGRNMSVS